MAYGALGRYTAGEVGEGQRTALARMIALRPALEAPWTVGNENQILSFPKRAAQGPVLTTLGSPLSHLVLILAQSLVSE